MSVTSPVVSEGLTPPSVVTTDELTTIVFGDGPSNGFQAEIEDKTVITSTEAPLKKAEVTVNAQKGETVELTVEATEVKKTDITVDGRGALDLTVNAEKLKKSTVSGKAKDDSISFGDARLRKVEVDLGKGDDTVTFGEGASFRGRNFVDLGKGGADVVEFEGEEPSKGKIIINNFDENDKLIIGGETFTKDDIEDDTFSNIKINFAD